MRRKVFGPGKEERAAPSALEAWAAIFARGGPRREEREAAACAIRAKQKYWLPILEELRREARPENRKDAAALFLLEGEIRRLRRELGLKAPSAAIVVKRRLQNYAQVRRYQRRKEIAASVTPSGGA